MTSTLKIDTIEPEGATTTLTVGESGQDTVIAGAGIKANVAKDAGANALFTSDGSGTISGLNSGFGSAETLIQTQTATAQASISFTSGITSTYKEYIFVFININPSAADTEFYFNGSSDSGSKYNVTKTTTWFRASHYENDTGYTFAYNTSNDLAQSADAQILEHDGYNDADACGVGELHLFNPASTTYVKNFYCEMQYMGASSGNGNSVNAYIGGYFNTTSVVDAIQFTLSTGTFDGTIKMYGIK